MGLFSNNKKLCPICDNPTPRIFPTKVENIPICKECDRKIDLPDGTINQMSLDDFKQYIDYYEENRSLSNVFREGYRFNFGFLGGCIQLDTANRLFRMKDDANALVFKAASLKSFCILEDNQLLFESKPNLLRCYESDVPERANAMAPQIAHFVMQQRQYEMMERMHRMEEQRHREEHPNGAPPPPRPPRPHFDMPVPFRHFYLEIIIDHPYWGSCRWELNAPTFDRNYPSIDNYLNEYQQKVDELHELAYNLMQFISPGAQEIWGNEEIPDTTQNPVTSQNDNLQAAVQNSAIQAATTMDAVTEIQRYKALLDAGILTEEEFTAKKRQLLGI